MTGSLSSTGLLTIARGAALKQASVAASSLGQVIVAPGGLITHSANVSARAAIVNLNVSGNFNLQAGASITASGLGYASFSGGAYGPGAGGYDGGGGGGGGGHGAGGGSGGQGAPGGAANDNVTNPSDLGSGGGGYPVGFTTGGNGGGAVVLNVGGTLTIDGAIAANGADGIPDAATLDWSGGGGAGGTVNLTAGALAGAGAVQANGGSAAAARVRGGGGGGGRVSIVVTGADSSSLNLQAYGGAGAVGGGTGAIALKSSGATSYGLLIGDFLHSPTLATPIPGAALTFSTITLNNAIAAFDAASTVTVNALVVAGTATLSAGSIVLGPAGLEVKPGGLLMLGAGSISGGKLVVDAGGAFMQTNTAPLSFTSVNVAPGGVLTHAANVGSRAAVLSLNVSGDFNLQAGASIAVSGLGYATRQGGAYGPGAGGYDSGGGGAGGGHGGAGGNSAQGGGGGAGNDGVTNPIDLGSGGGSYPAGYMSGGNGGGAVILSVGGTLNLNGAILANGVDGINNSGGNSWSGGGGAGGTVNLTAASLAGTGAVQANGGSAAPAVNSRGGGGGGGRVAVVVTGADSSSLNLQANSGNGFNNGGAGTISLKTPGGTNYNLSIGDLTRVPMSGSSVPGANPAFSTVTLNNSVVTFDPASTVNINSLIVAGTATVTANNLTLGAGGLKVKAGALLMLSANATSGGALQVDGGATFQQTNTAQLGFTSVNVAPGGVLTHAANGSARAAVLNLNVSGDFNLQAGASIAVSGLGYATRQGGAYGPGAGGNDVGGGGAGGGHGGIGGNSAQGGTGGAGNDSVTNPTDLGSGGGSYPAGYVTGGNGGGAVVLTVGGTLSLNGVILANGVDSLTNSGGNSWSGGGGAGGTVNLTAGALAGAGVVQANGGSAAPAVNSRGGGGSGGRVAVVVTATDSSSLNLQANSGNGFNNGAAGTISLKTPGGTNYNLSIGDLTHVPMNGTSVPGNPAFSTVTLNNSVVTFDSTSTVNINSLIVAGMATVTANSLVFGANSPLLVSSGAALNLTANSLSFGSNAPIEVQRAALFALAGQTITGGILHVRSGGTFQQSNAATLNFVSVLVETGGVLTHAANGSARAAVLNLNVSGDFNLQAGASIAVSGLGYATRQGGAYGPGAGGNDVGGGGAGGGHGGIGGNSAQGGAGGAGNDSVTNPTDLGSGGGSYPAGYVTGGNGGGAVVLTVGGTLSLNGVILANGVDSLTNSGGNSWSGGGGAGGTVNLTAGALAGAGVVQANGGSAAPAVNSRGGGGSGGRVAVVVTGADSSSLNLQANSGNGFNNGGAGTISLKTPGGTNYNLSIGDFVHSPQAGTPVPSTPAFAAITVQNAVVNFDTASTASVNALVVAGTATIAANGLALGAGGLEVKPGGVLILSANATSGGALQVDGGGTLQQANTAQLGFTSVNVAPGGVLTHAPNTSARAAVLNLNVSGDFNLQSGAAVAVSGLGYATRQGGAYGPGAGGYDAGGGGAGGGHGGAGGNSAQGGVGGVGNDSAANPTDLGSGGGSYPAGYMTGGNGGGAVILKAGGTLTINGSILANGGDGGNNSGGNSWSGGGGSGGTINLSAAFVNGNGLVQANGGSAAPAVNSRGGGGGGGRAALAGCGADRKAVSILGGAGNAPGQVGSLTPTVPAGCPSAPTAPINLRVVATGENASGQTFISAAWDATALTNFYTLQASTAPDFSGVLFSSNPVANAATLAGVTPNGTYFLRVSASNGVGASAFSTSVSTLTPADLTPPRAPTLQSAVGNAGARVFLNWTAAASGEQTASFNLYRTTFSPTGTAGLAPVLLHATATSYIDVPPADGTYFYTVTGLDPSFNESGPSNALSALALHAGPPSPTNLAAIFNPTLKQIALSWTASTGTVVNYNVYRATYSTSGVAGRVPLLTGTTASALVDVPPIALDATYYYIVTAVDPVGNEGTPSNQAASIFDTHAPVIAVSGVFDGQYTSQNLIPLVTIADFSAFTSTITLNGRPFVSGTTLASTGTYLLSVSAVDSYANASSATAAFTIDKTSPTLALLSPTNGLITNQNVPVAYQVTDDLTPTPKIVVTDELGNVVPSSYTITTEGARGLTLTARDLAGNAASAGATFILDRTPPVAVADLRVVAKSTATAQATLAWTSPHDALSGVAGYVVKAAPYPLTAVNFDAAPSVAVSTSPLPEGATERFVVSVPTASTVYFAQKSSDAAGNLSMLSNVAFWDLDGPVISNFSPPIGTVVSRPTSLAVQASDLTGVAQLAFSVDGTLIATATTPPYGFLWNTLAYADGAHSVTIKALDVLGNASTISAPYTLAYQPPQAPTIAFPPNNYTTRSATVAVSGMAPVGTTVQVLVDGFALGSASVSSTGSYQTSVLLPAQGTPLITATASDAKGSSSQSAPVAVNYNLAPPGSPANFAAAAAPAGHVSLTWSVPSGKVPAFYNVYRSTYSQAFSTGVVPAPAFLARSSVTATKLDDLPPIDGVYYYGATSLDSSGDESGLSAVASAVSDRVVPTASLIFIATAPPLGQGAWALRLTVSKPLALPPLLLFTPAGQSPLNIALGVSSPTVWVGTLTVTSTMNSGPGAFTFQGTDFVGNIGTTLTSGTAAAIDLTAPVGSISLNPPSPVKAGSVSLALTLSKPVPAAPSLGYVTAAGSTVPVVLTGGGTSWSGTLTISTGTDGPAAFVYRAVDGLGNAGTALSAGGSFAILTTAPGAPLYLRAIPQPAGAVRLTWSAPISGTPTGYNAYRSGVRIATGTAPLPDGSGAFTDSPADGSYSYTVTAVDAAGNESAPATPVAATSKSTLPAAPIGSTATLTAFGHIEVRWQAGSADSLAYKIYRTTTAVANLNIPIASSLSSSVVFSAPASTPPYVDTPPQNALYYYYLTAFDAAGNQSLPSSPATALWDRAPPTIIVTGVQDAGIYNYNVTPVFTATGSASAVTSAATLNNAPFLSGTPVAAEGDYTMVVNAVNQSNGSSTTTVHFTLDKTSPSVTIAGIPAGVSHSAVLPQVTVTDLHLVSVVLTLDGGAYAQGTPIATNGAHVFMVTAKDAAGNVTVSSAAITLNIPPSAPANFAMAAIDGQGATFSWQSPAPGLAGYRFYKDGAPLSQGLLTLLQFQDPSFALGTAHVYEVSAVDASGQEGTHAQLSVPAANFSLASYGVTLNGSQALTRGFFDTIQLQLVNSGSQSQFLGPATVELISSTSTVFSGQAAAATVAGGASVAVPAAVAVPVSIVDAPTLRVTLQLPSGLGTTATVAKSFPLAARAPLGSAVELFAGPMIFGANAQVQVKFNNKGSAPFEIRSAINSDLSISLATPQGTVLSQATLGQMGNGALTGSGVYFVSVGPGSSFLFDPVPVFVPSALASNAVLSAHVVQGYNGLAGSQPTAGGQSFDASQTISGVSAPAYTATISPDKPLYDQGPTVTLSGVAQDPTGALVPGATVQVGVSVQSFVRSLSTMTDASGHYSLTFNPAPTEAGLYTLWATNPSVVSRIPQSSFTIVGFGLQYASLTVPAVQNAMQTFQVSLSNTGQTALSSMTVRIVSTANVAGVSLALDSASIPASLGGGQTANLSFSALVSSGAPLGAVPFTVQLAESHGFARIMPVTVVVSASAANPAASPQAFTLGMNGGQTKLQTVILTNAGTKAWTGVTVSSPALSWVSIQGNTNPSQPFSLGDIAPGGQAQFVLSIAPASNQPTQAYALNPLVQVNSTNASPIPINALVTVTAGNTGGVVYNIINADKPRDQFGSGVPVASATVQLVSLDIAGLSFSAAGDANSVARLNNVPAGNYTLTAKAPGFNDYTASEVIQPGIVNTHEILLLTQVVSYTWTVTPTTIVDQYSLTLSLTYKTDVPAPVVIVSPAMFNFNIPSGGSADGVMTVTNQGIISAFNVNPLPKINDPHMTIDLPYSTIPELKAGQTITIPFHVALHSPNICYQGNVDWSGGYTCAAGKTVNALWPGAQINVNCGAPPSIVAPIVAGLNLPPVSIPGLLPMAPLVTAAVAGVVAPNAPPATACTCSMSIQGPATLLPSSGATTYKATLAANANCGGCNMSCDLGANWTATGDLRVVSQTGCTAQVSATGLNGGSLGIARNVAPSCTPGTIKVSGCKPQITASQDVAIAMLGGSSITFTATTPPGCPAQNIAWSVSSSASGTINPMSGPTTTFTPGATPGSLTLTAQDTTSGSTLATSTMVVVATVTFIGTSGHDTVGGDAFDRVNIAQGVNSTLQLFPTLPNPIVNVTASVIPADVFTLLPSGITLTNTNSGVVTLSPSILTAPQTSLSLQAVGHGNTHILATVPISTPIRVGKLDVAAFFSLQKTVAIHIIRDTSGHDASTLLSPADIQAIMVSDPHNVTSVWTQANISLVPYGLNMLPTFTADIVTVSTPIGSPVRFQDASSPDYVNILAAAKNPNADINVYYVPGLTDGTNSADGLTIPGARDSLVDANSRISRAHVTAHEIGHGLGLNSTAIPAQSDYHDPNRMYELMFWRTADYVGSILTYSGFTVVPYQGLIVNP